MTGYDFENGMSNNAVDAYHRGVKPLSKITADDLRAAGWTETKALAIRLAKSEFWAPCEWHHSGGTWFNQVDFFSPDDLVSDWQLLTNAERDKLRSPEKQENDELRVKGRYSIFGGSRRRPRYLGEENFTGTKIGNWIHVDGGGRKKADGNHIVWVAV